MAGVFVEIGSCDFDNYDVLLLDGWTGYFVEPVPEYFESLRRRIVKIGEERGKILKANFLRGAISNFSGEGEITYMPSNESDAWWVKGLGHVSGFQNNGIQMPGREHLASRAQTVKAQFYTLDDYFKAMSINHIDIMKVDVEGHELKVFNNYSWQIKPKHIKIEHTFVGLDPLLLMLKSNGYECTYDNEDIFGTFKG